MLVLLCATLAWPGLLLPPLPTPPDHVSWFGLFVTGDQLTDWAEVGWCRVGRGSSVELGALMLARPNGLICEGLLSAAG